MPRIYYDYRECEEFRDAGGMWRTVAGPVYRQQLIDAASKLMADPDRFRAAMRRALREWPRSCETNLTAESNNQRAWLGHAGCYLATGSVEECTRLAWHTLDATEQWAANHAADDVIALWRKGHRVDRDQLTMFEDDEESPQPPWAASDA